MKQIHRFVHRFHNPDLGILLVRLSLGIPFTYSGWYKIQHVAATLQFFHSVGISTFWMYVAMYGELLGGLAMLAGIWTRYAGIVLAIEMVVAIKVLTPSGFGVSNGGYEFALTLLLGSLAMIAFGSGKYSFAKQFRGS